MNGAYIYSGSGRRRRFDDDCLAVERGPGTTAPTDSSSFSCSRSPDPLLHFTDGGDVPRSVHADYDDEREV
jgi:hypothetical protein